MDKFFSSFHPVSFLLNNLVKICLIVSFLNFFVFSLLVFRSQKAITPDQFILENTADEKWQPEVNNTESSLSQAKISKLKNEGWEDITNFVEIFSEITKKDSNDVNIEPPTIPFNSIPIEEQDSVLGVSILGSSDADGPKGTCSVLRNTSLSQIKFICPQILCSGETSISEVRYVEGYTAAEQVADNSRTFTVTYKNDPNTINCITSMSVNTPTFSGTIHSTECRNDDVPGYCSKIFNLEVTASYNNSQCTNSNFNKAGFRFQDDDGSLNFSQEWSSLPTPTPTPVITPTPTPLPSITCNYSDRLTSTETINLGQSITFSINTGSHYSRMYIAKVPNTATRLANGTDITLLTEGAGSLTKIFTPTAAGIYVMETNTFDTASCNYMCSAGSILYKNEINNNCNSTNWTNLGNNCTSNCSKYIVVNSLVTPTPTPIVTPNSSPKSTPTPHSNPIITPTPTPFIPLTNSCKLEVIGSFDRGQTIQLVCHTLASEVLFQLFKNNPDSIPIWEQNIQSSEPLEIHELSFEVPQNLTNGNYYFKATPIQ